MDRTIWKNTLALIKRHARRMKRLPKAVFPDWLIMAMVCWHTAHTQPMYWACDRSNYPRWFKPKRLPSPSQFTRRVRRQRFDDLCQAIHEDAAGRGTAGMSFFDGKPLVVGPASKDPEAKRGHIMGGFAKGYKLHIWGTLDRRIPVFSVQSLNRGEQPVAEAMVAFLPLLSDRALVLADSNYDFAALYSLLAARNGALLVKPRGIAKHPKTLAQAGPYRREMLTQWQDPSRLAPMVYKQRIHVEGILSNLTCCSEGLGPLPAWVRGLRRVRRWVGIKIILYHMRLNARHKEKSLA